MVDIYVAKPVTHVIRDAMFHLIVKVDLNVLAISALQTLVRQTPLAILTSVIQNPRNAFYPVRRITNARIHSCAPIMYAL
jgi:hypothetical protein